MNESPKKRILVIEDEEHIAEALRLNLSLQGYAVETAASGTEGLQKWKERRPDLVVLDIMLPGIDGLTILRNIRLEDERIPILILSAKGSPRDRVQGLTFGVDDYLAKPFELEEFLLRVKRLLTRASWGSETARSSGAVAPAVKTYSFGENTIDFESAVAHCRQGEVHLTEQEVKLLKLFVANRGKLLSRKKILEIGWGFSKETTSRTLDNFIVRFRKYFEDNPKKPVYFRSRRSVGYVFDHD